MESYMGGSGDENNALTYSVRHWQRLMQVVNQHAIVSIADAAGNIVYVNPMFCQISGYGEQELLGQNHRLIKSGYHLPEFYHEMWRTISSGKTWKGEVCNRRKNGELYWVESTITPVLDDRGQPEQYVSVRTDITQLKQAEQYLAARNKIREDLTQIAQRLLVSPAEETRAAVDFALSLIAASWRADLMALFLSSQDAYPSDVFHHHAYPPLTAPAITALGRICLRTHHNQAAAPFIRFADVGLADGVVDGFSQGLLVPIQIGSDLRGYLIIAVNVDVDSWWQQYGDYVRLLGDMLIGAIGRSSATYRLQQTTERMNRGQAYANIGTWDWDIQRGALYWSERIAPLFGYTAGEIDTSYDNFIRAVHPDDRSSVERAINAAIVDDHPYDIEHRIVWPDGTVRWMLERGAVKRSADGTAQHMLGIVQDINERKLAQFALEERTEQLREAQEMARLATWHADLSNGKFTPSDNLYEIYGLDRHQGEITIDMMMAAIYPADRPQRDELAEQIKLGRGYNLTHRIVRPDGSMRYINIVGKVGLDEQHVPKTISGTVQDITDLALLQKQLHAAEQRFLFAVEGAGDGVWERDVRTNELTLSRLCVQMLGYTTDDHPHISFDQWRELMHPEDVAAPAQLQTDFMAGKTDTFSVQIRMRCKDGGYRWILSRGKLAERDEEGRPVRIMGVNSDIQAIKENEAALIIARNEANRANQAKSDFLSGMSHELRTPLNAILGFGQLLEMDETLSAENIEYASEIVNAGQHLLGLINEILDLARVEAGSSSTVTLEPVQLSAAISEVVTLLKPLADASRIRIDTAMVTDLPVQADRIRFKQIMINLLSNAIKYNHKNGNIIIAAHERDNGHIRVLVEDTGLGISAEKLNDIFKPFNRLGAESSTIEGTGIGLTLARKLVEMMGGEIGVDSKVGKGTTFWIDLPVANQGAAQTTARRRAAAAQYVLPGSRKRVLYIDDNPSNLRLVETILSTIVGIDYIAARSAEEGLELCETQSPDLILVDINMPGMSGYQVLTWLRLDPQFAAVPIFAVTANAMPEDINKGKAAGFNEYLCKPFEVDQFKQMITRYLSGEQGRLG